MSKSLRKRTLHVVFDTNSIWTATVHDLINNSASTLIRQHSNHADLKVCWLIPKVVRREREFQMRKKAFDLLPSVSKLEKLVGLRWGVDQDKIANALATYINAELSTLGISELLIDPGTVDWHALIDASTNRQAPFEDREKSEKGFRDAIICESFLQMAEKLSKSEIAILISNDELVQKAVQTRLENGKKTASIRVLTDLDALTSEINLLVSQVDEGFAGQLVDMGTKLFFSREDHTGLYYSQNVLETIKTKFADELTSKIEGITESKLALIQIAPAIFRKKAGQRVHFSSHVTLNYEDYAKVMDESGKDPLTALSGLSSTTHEEGTASRNLGSIRALRTQQGVIVRNRLMDMANLAAPRLEKVADRKRVIEVQWSTTLNRVKKLISPSIDDMLVHTDA